jgi:hypothetical protein
VSQRPASATTRAESLASGSITFTAEMLALGVMLLLAAAGMLTGRYRPLRIGIGLAGLSAVTHMAVIHTFPV